MQVQDLQRLVSPNRGKAVAIGAALAIVLSAAGCSTEDEATVPVACKQGPDAIRAALARAPARVTLDGTPLSGCLARGADPADVQLVGAAFVSAAARLAEDARSRPSGPAALQLGYLVAAVRRGATDTQGVYDELVRRVEQETIGVRTSSPVYRRGFQAGNEPG